MEPFIENLLTGIKQWVNKKIEDLSYVVSSHINSLTNSVSSLTQSVSALTSGKQDVLTAGSGIVLDSSSTISVSSTIIDGAAAGAAALPSSAISSWALAATKPTYTASEVGALPDDTYIPTKTSDLTNDSGYITIDDSDSSTGTTYSSSKILELIGNIEQFNVEFVNSLPVSGESHTIYFVPAQESGITSGSTDVCNEFMWINNKWEQIGSTRIDLSNYYTVSEVNYLLDDKQDVIALTAQEVLDFLNAEDEVGE